MGKISNAIQMLNYLNTGNKYSVKELSEKIGITERMVRYYKVVLEQAGIPIETFMGPNGGYYILNFKSHHNNFNKYDIQILEEAGLLDVMDEKLLDVCTYRKKYPEVSLQELSEIITLETGKKITKSGVHHRLKKISEMASNLSQK